MTGSARYGGFLPDRKAPIRRLFQQNRNSTDIIIGARLRSRLNCSLTAPARGWTRPRRTAHCRPRLLIAILEGDVRERIREGKMTVVNIHDRPEQAQRAVTPFCQLWDSL
jgi:hypothetical protein